MRQYSLAILAALAFVTTNTHAQEIDGDSHRSIVEALQLQIKEHPSVFPLEAYEGGVQSFAEGLRYPYFGYGERKYSHRTDFHPAMDVAYFPMEIGTVRTVQRKKKRVRAPQTYLKKVFAIQEGVLYSAARNSSGYKVILKHTLEQPYFDSRGRPYYEYYTCYRHVDPRTLIYLSLLARELFNDERATYEDLVEKYEFDAGETVAFVGFDPNIKSSAPRSHLDFSLNLFGDPDKGTNIRKYAFNPLLLFPPFDYADPYTHRIEENGVPAYQIVADAESVTPPTRRKNGRVQIEIHAGGSSADGAFVATRYFALNGMQVVVSNGGKELGSYTVDRHRKLGYDTSSYEQLDGLDKNNPHFSAPLGEQDDVFRMEAVVPASWLKSINYDWSKTGSISIELSSIWDGYLNDHTLSISIPLG